jgi:hypothetical protein
LKQCSLGHIVVGSTFETSAVTCFLYLEVFVNLSYSANNLHWKFGTGDCPVLIADEIVTAML